MIFSKYDLITTAAFQVMKPVVRVKAPGSLDRTIVSFVEVSITS